MENKNALDEINKGACMGCDAIDLILDKVTDKNLRKELEREYQNYKDIEVSIEKIYPKYDENGKPHETSMMNKAMTAMQVEMKTLTDESDSKIAEMILQGINMGIIEGRRIINKKEINKEVEKIVSEYVDMQEESAQIIKDFL